MATTKLGRRRGPKVKILVVLRDPDLAQWLDDEVHARRRAGDRTFSRSELLEQLIVIAKPLYRPPAK